MYNSGDACKLKVRRRFKPLGSIDDALRHYKLPPPGFQYGFTQTEQVTCDKAVNTHPVTLDFLIASLTHQFEQLIMQDQIEILELFFSSACKCYGMKILPHGYIKNSLSAMHFLQTRERSNILEGVAKVFGNMREDRSDSLFPTKRMPFGLFEHAINFYNAKSCAEVRFWLSIIILIIKFFIDTPLPNRFSNVAADHVQCVWYQMAEAPSWSRLGSSAEGPGEHTC